MSIALRRNALAALIKNNSDMDIKDVIRDNMYVIIPNGHSDSNSILFNLVYGKTYRMIFKNARNLPNSNQYFTAYKGNSNTPNANIGQSDGTERVYEFSYTHTQTDTYTRIGVWNNSGSGSNYAILLYIEEL